MSDDNAFLAGIAATPDDPLPRLVYADFLDDRGDPRAEVVRLEQHLVAHPADDAALKRFRDLAAACDPRWLARVVRPAVARCGIQFDYECPRKWTDLTPTADPAARHCDECGQPVFLALTRADAQLRAVAGDCVAIDSRLVSIDELPADGWVRYTGHADDLTTGPILRPDSGAAAARLLRRALAARNPPGRGLAARLWDRLLGRRP